MTTTALDPQYTKLGASDLPEQVRVLADSLDLHGRRDLLLTAGIGLCGSRDASDRGIELARAAGIAAADMDVPLVSGYARGIDTAGHIAALSANGPTVAVLAEGIDQFRLREEYRGLHDELEKLIVVSQFDSAAGWSVRRAMMRNALICALSALLVVIEPGESGGTIAAAREALRTSRDGRKQPLPLILVLREDHEDALRPEVAKLRRREGVTCVGTVEELEAAIQRAFASPNVETAPQLL